MKFTEIFRPNKFDDVIGQEHLLSENSVFKNLIQTNEFESILLLGPSGSGKTTLAELIGNYLSLPFYRLNAASAGNSDIKKIIETTRHYGKPALIFVDEIHRFTKVQQDLLLDVIDGKHGKFIGASTENPYHSLTNALRSRSIIFKLNKISEDNFLNFFRKIKQELKQSFDVKDVIIDDADLKRIIKTANGDFRKFLNIFEIISLIAEKKEGILYLNFKDDEHFGVTTYSADEHYDLFSALIKSIRGTDPDAALLWGMKLLQSGVSALEIFRRLLISASEDIGNAFPDAITFVNSAYSSFEKVGMPEGKIILSQTICFLASCPKSNRTYKALHNVEKYLDEKNPYPPKNIRQNHVNYNYPFDFGEFVEQKYKNDNEIFYYPSESGFEKKILDRLKRLWNRNYE